MKRLRLCLLWHMHQPSYLEPETERLALPWVRLHALRGYADMAALTRAHPFARQTFNFTPCLLEQLDALVRGTWRDNVQEICRKPVAELSPREREEVIRNFFSVAWEHNIRPLPRYAALLARRGVDLATVDLSRAARLFSDADLRDLEVFFHLAWCGHEARKEEIVAALLQKGAGYTEDEKNALVAACDRFIAPIAHAYRELAREGRCELTSTPFYHPILPLLVNSDAAAISRPDRPLPPRFSAPEDAREQIARSLTLHEQTFGARPAGMWPAEGSVSPEVVPLFEEAGVPFIASDEGVLLRSLPPGTARESALYHPWHLPGGAGRLVGFFRDHALSDNIGFTYQTWSPRAAAEDFVGRLAHIAANASGTEAPVVSVILDGENPWEHYPHSGWEHLSELFHAIERSGFIDVGTFGEAAASAREALPRLHAGSWIESSFRIWIGGAEENRAWTLLGETRRLLGERSSHPGASAARDHLLAAEGSDWFWWYGDDFASDQKPDFDRLFRGRIQAACRAMGVSPPPAALEPIARGKAAAPSRLPAAPISPTLGSRAVQGWLGAGRYDLASTRGSMYGGEALFRSIEFGSDLQHLYVRLAPRADDWRARLAGGQIRLVLHSTQRREELVAEVGQPEAHWPQHALLHIGRAFECRVPLASFGARPGEEVGLAVVVARNGGQLERYPAQGMLTFRTSSGIENWCV
jgi:alpha-amylase/alpha-mannosidase (GH57 family)